MSPAAFAFLEVVLGDVVPASLNQSLWLWALGAWSLQVGMRSAWACAGCVVRSRAARRGACGVELCE